MFTSLKNQLKETIEDYFGIVDNTGKIVMCSDDAKEDTHLTNYDSLISDDSEIIELEGLLYQKIAIGRTIEYYVFLRYNNDYSYKTIKLIAINVTNYIKFHMDKYNKSYFLKSLIQETLSVNEINKKSIHFKLKNNYKRIVICIRSTKISEYPVSNLIMNIFPDNRKNYAITLDNGDTVYICEAEGEKSFQKAYAYATMIIDTIEEELMIPANAGVGNICSNLGGLKESYKNAVAALEIGAIFESQRTVYSFNTLGIGRLIHQTKMNTLEAFLRETVDEETFAKLDDEIIKTVQNFFDNNLNISETARQMYLHRNTLVYRIDKVLKYTGLDVRNFDDAVSFKAAYMVKSYLDKLREKL